MEGSQDPLDSRVRTYYLCREPFDELRDWVQKVEAFWTDQLDSFRDHIDRTEEMPMKTAPK